MGDDAHMQLHAREKSLLSVLLLVVVVVGVWHLTLASLWNRYISATEVTHSLSGRLESAKVNMVGRNDMRNELSVLKGVLARVAPEDVGDPGTLAVRELEQATRHLDLRLVEIKPSTERKVGAFITMPISVRGEGDYAALVSFLTRLHITLPSYEVTKAQVNSAGQQGERVDFSLSITARRYMVAEANK
jgi:Tfp pilus assembly protein PilO